MYIGIKVRRNGIVGEAVGGVAGGSAGEQNAGKQHNDNRNFGFNFHTYFLFIYLSSSRSIVFI
jgi:hypothetical protein